MAKIRKNKKRQRYQYKKNRKRMNKKPTPSLKNPIVEAWSNKRTAKHNMKKIGLVYNLNDLLPPTEAGTSLDKPRKVSKAVQLLEEEANAPREKTPYVTSNQLEFYTYMLDKYGDDFKAMTRDKKNEYQMTEKQLKSKLTTFKNTPELYKLYLDKKELSCTRI